MYPIETNKKSRPIVLENSKALSSQRIIFRDGWFQKRQVLKERFQEYTQPRIRHRQLPTSLSNHLLCHWTTSVCKGQGMHGERYGRQVRCLMKKQDRETEHSTKQKLLERSVQVPIEICSEAWPSAVTVVLLIESGVEWLVIWDWCFLCRVFGCWVFTLGSLTVKQSDKFENVRRRSNRNRRIGTSIS